MIPPQDIVNLPTRPVSHCFGDVHLSEPLQVCSDQPVIIGGFPWFTIDNPAEVTIVVAAVAVRFVPDYVQPLCRISAKRTTAVAVVQDLPTPRIDCAALYAAHPFLAVPYFCGLNRAFHGLVIIPAVVKTLVLVDGPITETVTRTGGHVFGFGIEQKQVSGTVVVIPNGEIALAVPDNDVAAFLPRVQGEG